MDDNKFVTALNGETMSKPVSDDEPEVDETFWDYVGIYLILLFSTLRYHLSGGFMLPHNRLNRESYIQTVPLIGEIDAVVRVHQKYVGYLYRCPKGKRHHVVVQYQPQTRRLGLTLWWTEHNPTGDTRLHAGNILKELFGETIGYSDDVSASVIITENPSEAIEQLLEAVARTIDSFWIRRTVHLRPELFGPRHVPEASRHDSFTVTPIANTSPALARCK